MPGEPLVGAAFQSIIDGADAAAGAGAAGAAAGAVAAVAGGGVDCAAGALHAAEAASNVKIAARAHEASRRAQATVSGIGRPLGGERRHGAGGETLPRIPP